MTKSENSNSILLQQITVTGGKSAPQCQHIIPFISSSLDIVFICLTILLRIKPQTTGHIVHPAQLRAIRITNEQEEWIEYKEFTLTMH